MDAINLQFGTLAKKVAEHLKLRPTQRPNGRYQWYKIIADGSYEADGFNWQLKEKFIEALLELGILSENRVFPDEISFADKAFMESGVKKVWVNAYERNSLAREKCIEHFGAICRVCNINFERIYCEIGKDFVHVHHIVMRSKMGNSKYIINPIKDLIPVCPNCHSMLHRRSEPYSIDELKDRIKFRYP